MSKGIIYITTTSVKGLIKIGKTRTDQFENRMATLEQNGYWNVNGLHRYFAVEVDDYDEKEKLIHTIFSKSQVDKSELFALDKDLAKELLESFGGIQIYPFIENKTPNEIKKEIKCPLTFSLIDIPVGSELTYIDNQNIKVITVDDKNKVRYDGKIYSLSKLVLELKKNDGIFWKSAQGGNFFSYNGEILTDIRKRKGL